MPSTEVKTLNAAIAKAKRLKRKQVSAAERMEPSDWRAQHATAVIEEPSDNSGQLKRKTMVSPVEALYRRGSISSRQYLAAVRLYDSYVLGIVGARDPEKGGGNSGYSIAGMADAQLSAATDYRKAMQALGRRMSGVIENVVISEEPLSVVAQRLGLNQTKLLGALDIALDVLADWYRMPE